MQALAAIAWEAVVMKAQRERFVEVVGTEIFSIPRHMVQFRPLGDTLNAKWKTWEDLALDEDLPIDIDVNGEDHHDTL